MAFNCALALIVVCILIVILFRFHKKSKADNIPTNSNNAVQDESPPESPNDIVKGMSQDESSNMWDDPVLAARLAEELENKWKIRSQTNSRAEQLRSEGEEPLNQEWMQGSSNQHNRVSRKTGVNTAANRDKIDI